MACMHNTNLFIRNILLHIYKIHISILICCVIKQSLFSYNVLFPYDVNSLSLYDITVEFVFLNIKLNDVKWKFCTLISVYDVKIWIQTHISLCIIIISALLHFANTKICLLFLRCTGKERITNVIKVLCKLKQFKGIPKVN
jgi:hypothetical protein